MANNNHSWGDGTGQVIDITNSSGVSDGSFGLSTPANTTNRERSTVVTITPGSDVYYKDIPVSQPGIGSVITLAEFVSVDAPSPAVIEGQTTSAGRILAKGGTSHAYSTARYKFWSRTIYTDGTYVDGEKSNGSLRIEGEDVTASSKGSTVSNVTAVGTSTPTGVLPYPDADGNEIPVTSPAYTIQQEANVKTTTYSVPTLVFDAPDVIPAAGGTSMCPDFTYSQTQTDTYTSEAVVETTLTEGGTKYYASQKTGGAISSYTTTRANVSISADSLLDTEISERVVGKFYGKVTLNGKTSDPTPVNVSQSKNEFIGYEYDAPTFDLSVPGIVPAGGGDSDVLVVTNLKQTRWYCYSAGERIKCDDITTGMTVYYGTGHGPVPESPANLDSSKSSIHADSLGTTITGTDIVIGYACVTVIGNADHDHHKTTTTSEKTVYQQGNVKGVATSVVQTLNVDTANLVPGACSVDVTGSCVHKGKYTSGTDWTDTYPISSIALKTGASANFSVDNSGATKKLVHASMGTNVSTDSCVVVATYDEGHTKESGTISVVNAIDHYGVPEGIDLTVDDIPASGATGGATMFDNYCHLTGTCEQEIYYESGAHETIYPTYTITLKQSNKDKYDSLGTTPKVRSAVGVYTIKYSANGVSSEAVEADIWQEANEVYYGNIVGSMTITVPDIPADGGTVKASDCTVTATGKQSISYTSGATRQGIVSTSVTGADVSTSTLGTTVKERTVVKSNAFTLTTTGEGGKSKSVSFDCWQAANAKTYIEYVAPNFTSLSLPSGGEFDLSLLPTQVTNNQQYYTSGSHEDCTSAVVYSVVDQWFTPEGQPSTVHNTITRFKVVSGTTLHHDSMASNVGTDHVVVRATNVGDETKYTELSADIKNTFAKEDTVLTINDSNLTQSGGSVSVSGSCTHTWSSGYKETYDLASIAIKSTSTGSWTKSTSNSFVVNHGAMTTDAGGATVTDTLVITGTYATCGTTKEATTSIQNKVVSTTYAMPTVSFTTDASHTGLAAGTSSAVVSHPNITTNYYTYDYGKQYFTTTSTLSIGSQTYTPKNGTAVTTTRFSLSNNIISHTSMGANVGVDKVIVVATNSGDSTKFASATWESVMNDEDHATHTPTGAIQDGITAAGGSATVAGNCAIKLPSGTQYTNPISSVSIKTQNFRDSSGRASAVSRFHISGTTLSHDSMGENVGTDNCTVTITYSCGTTFETSVSVSNALIETVYDNPTVTIEPGLSASDSNTNVKHLDITTNYRTYNSGSYNFTTTSSIELTTNGNDRFVLEGNNLIHKTMGTYAGSDTAVITAYNNGDRTKTATDTVILSNAIQKHTQYVEVTDTLKPGESEAEISGYCEREWGVIDPDTGAYLKDRVGISRVEIASQTYGTSSTGRTTITRYHISGTTLSHDSMNALVGTDEVTITVVYTDGCTENKTLSVENKLENTFYETPSISFTTDSTRKGFTAKNGSVVVSHPDTTGNYREYTSTYKDYFTKSTTIAITTNGNNRFSLSGNVLSHSNMTSNVTTDTVVVTATNSGDSSKTKTDTASVSNAEGTHTYTASWISKELNAGGGSGNVTGSDTFKYTSETDGSYAIKSVTIIDQHFVANGSTTRVGITRFSVSKVSNTNYKVSHTTMGTNVGVDYVTIRVTFNDDHCVDLDEVAIANAITFDTYDTPTITLTNNLTAGGGNVKVSCPDVTTNYHTYASGSTKNFTTTPTISYEQTCTGGTDRFSPTTGIVSGSTINHSSMTSNVGSDSITVTAYNSGKTASDTASVSNDVTHTPSVSVSDGLSAGASSATVTGTCTDSYTSNCTPIVRQITGIAINTQYKTGGTSITRYSVSTSSPWKINHSTMGTEETTDYASIKVTFSCGYTKDITVSVENMKVATTYATPSVSFNPDNLTAAGGTATVVHPDITTNYYTYASGATSNFTTSSTIALTTNGNNRFALDGNTVTHDNMLKDENPDTVYITATNGDKFNGVSKTITNVSWIDDEATWATIANTLTAGESEALITGSALRRWPSGSSQTYGINNITTQAQTYTNTSGNVYTITRFSQVTGNKITHSTMGKNLGTDTVTIVVVFDDKDLTQRTTSASVVNTVTDWTYATPLITIGTGLTPGASSALVAHPNANRTRSYTSGSTDVESMVTTIAITSQTFTETGKSAVSTTRFSLDGDELSHTTMGTLDGVDRVTVTATNGNKTASDTKALDNSASIATHSASASIGTGIPAGGAAGSATVTGSCVATYKSGATKTYGIQSVAIKSQTCAGQTVGSRFSISGTTLSHSSMTSNDGTDTCTVTVTFTDGHTAEATVSAVNTYTTTYGTPTVSIGTGLGPGASSATVTHGTITDNHKDYSSGTVVYFDTNSNIEINSQTYTETGKAAVATTRFTLNGNTLSHATMAKNLGVDLVVIKATNAAAPDKYKTATTSVTNSTTHTQTASIGSGITAGGGSATVTGNCSIAYASGASSDTSAIKTVAITSQTFTNAAGTSSAISRFTVSGTTLSHTSMCSNVGTDSCTVTVTYNDGHTKTATTSVANAKTSITYATPSISLASNNLRASGGNATFTVSLGKNKQNYTSGTCTTDVDSSYTFAISSQTCAGGTNRYSVSGLTLSHTTMGRNFGTDEVTVWAYNNGDSTKYDTWSTSVSNSDDSHVQTASIGTGITAGGGSATVTGSCVSTATSEATETYGIKSVAIKSQTCVGQTVGGRFTISGTTLSHSTMGTAYGTDSCTVTVTFTDNHTKDATVSVTNGRVPTYDYPTISIGTGITAGGGSATVSHPNITTNYYTYDSGSTENFTTTSSISIQVQTFTPTSGSAASTTRFSLSGNTLSHTTMAKNLGTDYVLVRAKNDGAPTLYADGTVSVTNAATHTQTASIGSGITAGGGSATVTGNCTTTYTSGATADVSGIKSVVISSQKFGSTNIDRFSVSGTTLSHTTMCSNVGTDTCTVTVTFNDNHTKTATTSVQNAKATVTYATPVLTVSNNTLSASGGYATVSVSQGANKQNYTSGTCTTDIASTYTLKINSQTCVGGTNRFSLSNGTLSHDSMGRNFGSDSVELIVYNNDSTSLSDTWSTSITNSDSHTATATIGTGITAAGGSATVSGTCVSTPTSGSSVTYQIQSVAIKSQTFTPTSGSASATTRFHISGTTLSHDSMGMNAGTDSVTLTVTYTDGHTKEVSTSVANAYITTYYGTPHVSIGSGITAAGGAATISHADITDNYYEYTSGKHYFTTNSTISGISQACAGQTTGTRFSRNGNALSHTTMGTSAGNDTCTVTVYNSGNSAYTNTDSVTVNNKVESHSASASIGSGITAGGGSATVSGNCDRTYTSDAHDYPAIKSVAITSQTFGGAAITRFSVSGTTLSHTTMAKNQGTDICVVTVTFDDNCTKTATVSVSNAPGAWVYTTPTVSIGNGITAGGGSATVSVSGSRSRTWDSGSTDTEATTSSTGLSIAITSQTFNTTTAITRFSLDGTTLSHTTMAKNLGTDSVTVTATNGDKTKTATKSVTNSASHAQSASIGTGITAAGGSATVSGKCTITYTSGASADTSAIKSVAITSQTCGGSAISRFTVSGTTLSHTTMGETTGTDSCTVTVTFNDNHTTTATTSVSNALKSTVYATPSVSIGDGITAKGGSATVTHGTITTNYKTYDSGTYYFNTSSTITGITQTCANQTTGSRFSINGDVISHTTMGTNAGTDSVTVTVKNNGDASKTNTATKSVTNGITGHSATASIGSGITAKGGSATVTGSCTRTYTSEATDTSGIKSVAITSQTFGGSVITRFSISGTTLSHTTMAKNNGTDICVVTVTFDDNCTASATTSVSNEPGPWVYTTPTISIGSGITAKGGSATVSHPNSTRTRTYTSESTETEATTTTIAITSQTFDNTTTITRFSLSGNTLSHTTMAKNVGTDRCTVTVTNGDKTNTATASATNAATHSQSASIGSGIIAAGGSATVSGSCTVSYTSEATSDVYGIQSVVVSSQSCAGQTKGSRFSISNGTTLTHTSMGTSAGNDSATVTVTFTDGHTTTASTGNISNALISTTYATPTVSIENGLTAGASSATISHPDITTNYYTYTSGNHNFTTSSSVEIQSQTCAEGTNRFSRTGNTITHTTMGTIVGTDSVTVKATNNGDSTKTNTATKSVSNAAPTAAQQTHTMSYSTTGSLTASGGYLDYTGSCDATGTYTSGAAWSASYSLSNVKVTSQSCADSGTRFTADGTGTRLTHTTMYNHLGNDSATLTLTYADGHTKSISSGTVTNSRGDLHTVTPTISLNPDGLTAGASSATVVHADCRNYYLYTSNYYEYATVASTIAITSQTASRYSLSGNTLSHSTMGTTTGDDTVTVTATNPSDTTKTASVTKTVSNSVDSHSPNAYIGSGITAGGGSATVGGNCARTYTSGSKDYSAVSSIAFQSGGNGNSRFSISGLTISHDSMAMNLETDTVKITATFADGCTQNLEKSYTNSREVVDVVLEPRAGLSSPSATVTGTSPDTEWDTIPASGAYVHIYGHYHYKYTSGVYAYVCQDSSATPDSTTAWMTRQSNGDYYVANRGTTYSATARSIALTWSGAGMTSPSKVLRQAANTVSISFVTAPTFNNTRIPAGGGSTSLSNSPVVRLTFSSGSTIDTTYPSTSYGTWSVTNQSADSKAKTPSGVTNVGNASVTFTASSTYGSATGTSNVPITQAANIKYSSYGTPTGLSITTSDIPASGTTSYSPTGTVSGTCSQKCYYTSGEYDESPVTYTGSFTSNITGSAIANLDTTPASRTSKGTLTYTYTANGKSNTATCTIYQEANSKTLVSTDTNYSPSGYTVACTTAATTIGTAANSTQALTIQAYHSAYNRSKYSWTSGSTSYEQSTGTHTVSDNANVSINDTTNFSISASTVANNGTVTVTHTTGLAKSTEVNNSDYGGSNSGYTVDSISIDASRLDAGTTSGTITATAHHTHTYYIQYKSNSRSVTVTLKNASHTSTTDTKGLTATNSTWLSDQKTSTVSDTPTLAITSQTFTPTSGTATAITRFSISGTTLSHASMTNNVGTDYVKVSATNGSSVKYDEASVTNAVTTTDTNHSPSGYTISSLSGQSASIGKDANSTASYSVSATHVAYNKYTYRSGYTEVSSGTHSVSDNVSWSVSDTTNFSVTGTTASTGIATLTHKTSVEEPSADDTNYNSSYSNYSFTNASGTSNTLSASGGSVVLNCKATRTHKYYYHYPAASHTVTLTAKNASNPSTTTTLSVSATWAAHTSSQKSETQTATKDQLVFSIYQQTFTNSSGTESSISRFSLGSTKSISSGIVSQTLNHSSMGTNVGHDDCIIDAAWGGESEQVLSFGPINNAVTNSHYNASYENATTTFDCCHEDMLTAAGGYVIIDAYSQATDKYYYYYTSGSTSGPYTSAVTVNLGQSSLISITSADGIGTWTIDGTDARKVNHGSMGTRVETDGCEFQITGINGTTALGSTPNGVANIKTTTTVRTTTTYGTPTGSYTPTTDSAYTGGSIVRFTYSAINTSTPVYKDTYTSGAESDEYNGTTTTTYPNLTYSGTTGIATFTPSSTASSNSTVNAIWSQNTGARRSAKVTIRNSVDTTQYATITIYQAAVGGKAALPKKGDVDLTSDYKDTTASQSLGYVDSNSSITSSGAVMSAEKDTYIVYDSRVEPYGYYLETKISSLVKGDDGYIMGVYDNKTGNYIDVYANGTDIYLYMLIGKKVISTSISLSSIVGTQLKIAIIPAEKEGYFSVNGNTTSIDYTYDDAAEFSSSQIVLGDSSKFLSKGGPTGSGMTGVIQELIITGSTVSLDKIGVAELTTL